MKKIMSSFMLLLSATMLFAQVDKEQLALDVSKADAANTQQLKSFIWKRYTTATVKGEQKASAVHEFAFDVNGKIQMTEIDTETSARQKRGIRGSVQKSNTQDKLEYVENATQVALKYTYMTKGQLLDFFEKAMVVALDDIYQVKAKDVLAAGDQLYVEIDKATLLYRLKKFHGMMGEDPISGEVHYAPFSSGINHVTHTVLNLKAKEAVIEAKNQDYSQRVE